LGVAVTHWIQFRSSFALVASLGIEAANLWIMTPNNMIFMEHLLLI
jgi:hypothetical protein